MSTSLAPLQRTDAEDFQVGPDVVRLLRDGAIDHAAMLRAIAEARSGPGRCGSSRGCSRFFAHFCDGDTDERHAILLRDGDVAAVYKEILIGLGLSALVAVFVPKTVWATMFLEGHPVLSRLVGPFAGPLVALFSFVFRSSIS